MNFLTCEVFSTTILSLQTVAIEELDNEQSPRWTNRQLASKTAL